MVTKKYDIKVFLFSGSGNLFTLIDNINLQNTVEFYTTNARYFCVDCFPDKPTEGLIVINPDSQYDFNVWFFNPDGTSGMMCGNGGRCAIYYYVTHIMNCYIEGKFVQFSMNENVYTGSANNGKICICFAPPKQLPVLKTIEIDTITYKGYFVDVGSPHLVLNVEQTATQIASSINDIDVVKLGKKMRQHPEFAPVGTNVNFFQAVDVTTVFLRTYERGVEDETGACGTGSIATALVCYQSFACHNPLNIVPTSKSPLSVELIFPPNADKNLSNLERIILSGDVSLLN